MGKKPKIKNPYVKLGSCYYELADEELAWKKTCSRKVFDALRGIFWNDGCWKQANEVEEILFMKMAGAAVRAVRAWDAGETKCSLPPSPIRGTPGKIPKEICDAVRKRSHSKCEIRQDGICEGPAYNFHHVVQRRDGGPHSLENIKHACFNCHQWTHGNLDL